MGLRARLRRRAQSTAKSLLERLIGEGPEPGTSPSDAGPAHAARTGAWPPGVMGEVAHAAEPPAHPADLAEAGEVVAESADFRVGDWEIEEGIEDGPAEAALDPEPTPSLPTNGVRMQSRPGAPPSNGTPSMTPAGSVAQQEWLPMPKPPAQAPAEEPEPSVEAAQEPVEADAPTEEAEAPTDTVGAPILLDEDARERLAEEIVAVLHTVYDPEIPVDIYELGLIYGVDVAQDGTAEIRMTLTSPNCPAAQSMPAEVETKAGGVEGIRQAMVDIVWEPPWGPEMMSEAAKLELNLDF